MKNVFYLIFFFAFLLISCQEEKQITTSGLKVSDFKTKVDSLSVQLYVLKNKNGLEACITNYGARVVSLMVPDRNGKLEDVVAGYSNIADYLAKKQNFGATVGRYIGRILNASFSLDSVTYKLTPNTGEHCSHGGPTGFAYKVWTEELVNDSTLRLSLLSPDNENGFPGNLQVYLTYTLTSKNELDIQYEAITDKPTVINLSHHSFFNISGDFNTTVEDQLLYVNANRYTPFDSLKCVTGEILEVSQTPFDFLTPRLIGDRINEDNMQLSIVKGYDHNWVLNTNGDTSILAAKLSDLKSGRTLEIYTNEPGIQIYTANGLRGAMIGKKGIAYQKRSSICLETQHFADSPNKPQFPSTVLRPGEKYNSRCIYRFGIIEE